MTKIQPVSKIKRSLHYLIDYSAIPLLFALIQESKIIPVDTSGVQLILLFANFFLLEPITGKTIAKYITHTTTVTRDGKKVHFFRGMLKEITRCIPFDLLSFFFSNNPVGWHDKLSGTIVVEDNVVSK